MKLYLFNQINAELSTALLAAIQTPDFKYQTSDIGPQTPDTRILYFLLFSESRVCDNLRSEVYGLMSEGYSLLSESPDSG